MDSNAGLAIQCVGILLVTLLSFFIRRSIRNTAFTYWTIGWVCLAVSLVSLFVGFQVIVGREWLFSTYFFGEYCFSLLFIAGCRNHVNGSRIEAHHYFYLIPALVASLALPYLSNDFNDLFIVHASAIATLFATSLIIFWIGTRGEKRSPGTHVMLTALVALTVGFYHYVPVFASRKGMFPVTVPDVYLRYTSIFDLVFEILLGFGIVMVLMEGVKREVEQTNGKLVKARDQLEMLAQMDPLTEALNRHAFHSLLNQPEHGNAIQTSGCVAVIDIDNLKPINDTLGHPAGDKAIRAVARAMRSLIRADDMLFRWGGDEFLVLMFLLPDEEASRRMEGLNKILEDNCRRWTGLPITVSVSHGVAGFDSLRDLADAIELADRKMYRSRIEARSVLKTSSVM